MHILQCLSNITGFSEVHLMKNSSIKTNGRNAHLSIFEDKKAECSPAAACCQ